MAKRIKINGVRGLKKDARTGMYYLRRSVNGTEVERSLETKSLREAKIKIEETLDDVKAEQKSSRRMRFEAVGEAIKEILRPKAEKTYLDFENHYRLHLLPYFRGKFMDQIERVWEHYKAVQKSVVRRTPKGKLLPTRKLKHDAAHLRRMLRYAHKQKALLVVPELDLDASDREPEPGRVYAPDEFRRLWAAANPKWKLILEMAAIMGMRRGEIRNLRWDYLDMPEAVIRLPKEATKTRRGRTVPVEPQILEALRALEPLMRPTSPWVFPNSEDAARPMNPTDRTWRRIQKRADVKGKFHWLRHSNVSWAVRGGFAPKLVQKTRGMSSQVMDRIYTHADNEDAMAMNSHVRQFLETEGLDSTKPDARGNAGSDLKEPSKEVETIE
jgi:integrase